MIYPSTSKLEWAQTPSGIILPKDCIPKPMPKAFDFFAGCGGFSLGLHQGGFHVIGAMEWDKYAAHTYMVNLGSYPMQIHFDTDERKNDFEKYIEKSIKKHMVLKSGIAGCATAGSGWISQHPDQKGCEHFWIADIRNYTGKQILDTMRMEVGELDLVVGGPPCQGFSSAGKQIEDDPRNNLVFEYARMIVEMRPKTFVMENVPEFATLHDARGIGILDQFMRIVADGDFAPYESLAKSLLGRKNSKAVIRSERKTTKVKKWKGERPNGKPLIKPETSQASLF